MSVRMYPQQTQSSVSSVSSSVCLSIQRFKACKGEEGNKTQEASERQKQAKPIYKKDHLITVGSLAFIGHGAFIPVTYPCPLANILRFRRHGVD